MVIHCQDLGKKHYSQTVLQNMSFDIKEHTITGLIGRNGAGKTTLLKMIAGFWRKTKGEMTVFGVDPFDHLTVSANTIFVDDQMAFPETLTLSEILIEAERFYPYWDAILARRLFEYFHFDKGQIHTNLSKGKKSTFNMIVGMASRAPLTIFDEPTTGMDSAVRKDFYRALLKDYIAYPRTIIISSHHLDEIEGILENMLLLDEGELLFHLPIDEVREYAVGITGSYSQLLAAIRHEETIYQEKIGMDELYVVMKNDEKIERMAKMGFRISAVSPEDLVIFMTGSTKGGIDDVFRKSE